MRNGPVPLVGACREPFSEPGQFLIHLRAHADLIQLCLELLIAQRRPGAAPGFRGQQVIERGRPCLQVSFLIFRAAGGRAGVRHLAGDPGEGLGDAGLAWARAAV